MAIAYRGRGVATDGSGTTSAPGIPAGTILNDLLIATTCGFGLNETVTFPAGWTKKQAVINGSTFSVAYKQAGASESAPTISYSATGTHGSIIYCYTGVSSITPVEATSSAVTGTVGSGTQTITGGMTTASPDMIVCAGMSNRAASNTLSSFAINGTGVTPDANVNDGLSFIFFACSLLQGAAGSTGNTTLSASSAFNTSGGLMLALAVQPTDPVGMEFGAIQRNVILQGVTQSFNW